MPPDISTIKPGSILLYNTPGDVVDEIITRTGPAAHVEFYEGNGKSLASRNGIGVNRYDFRSAGLIAILETDVDVAAFSAWFETVIGDAYDWSGLMGFVEGRVTQEAGHWFCSAVIAKGFQMVNFPLFNHLWNASLIDPTDMLKTPVPRWKWVDVSQVFMFTA